MEDDDLVFISITPTPTTLPFLHPVNRVILKLIRLISIDHITKIT